MGDASKELFAVNIHGPDDLIPVDDYAHAVRLAHAFNAWWVGRVAVDHREYDPRMWAVPVVWPYEEADAHAKWLVTPSVDYAELFQSSRKAEAV